MKTILLLLSLSVLSCTSPFAPPDAGETAVAMHAASFAPNNLTMAERQERFYQMQSMMVQRNPHLAPYRSPYTR